MSWIKDTFFGGAAKDAARVQMDSLDKAMGIQREASESARSDIMQMFDPAYNDLIQGFTAAQDQIAQGRTSTANIYSQATGQANQLLQQGTNASIAALMGQNPSPSQFQSQPFQPMAQLASPPESFGKGGTITLPQQPNQPTVSSMGLRQPTTDVRTAGTGIRPTGDTVMQMTGLRQPQSQMNDMAIRPDQNGQIKMPFGRNFSVGVVPQQQPQMQTQQQQSLPEQLNAGSQNIQSQQLGQLPVQNTGGIQMPDVSGIGLSGAESAIIGGAQGAESALTGGLRSATGTFNQAMQGQIGALQGGAQGAQQAVQQGASGALDSINTQFGQAASQFDPYSQAGQQALQREAAMSGALGSQAQQQAMDSFMESPGQKYLREQAEKSLLRNASATGGLRGGSTLSALQEQAIGLSAQQQQQQLENLRSLAGRGQQAAGSIAGLQSQQGQLQAGIQQSEGSQLANLQQALGQNVAGAIGQTGSQIGQAQMGTGQSLSGLRQGIGSQLGSLRMGVGQQVAGQLSGLGQSQAQNQLNLGSQLGNLDQSAMSNLSNLLQNQGQQGFASRMQLAQILANLATGQGTNLSNLQSQIGTAAAGGITGAASGAAGGVGAVTGLISQLSDIRLKDDIKQEVKTASYGVHSWTWKDMWPVPKNLRGKRDAGVLAQEVAQFNPNAVSVDSSGYLKVNLGAL